MLEARVLRRRVVMAAVILLAGAGGWMSARASTTMTLDFAAAASSTMDPSAAMSLAVPTSPPAIHAIAELYLPGPDHPDGPPVEMRAYTLLPASSSFAWPDGDRAGELESGIGLIALPHFVRAKEPTGPTTVLAIANLTERPGRTSFVVLFFDANGLLDYACQSLNEGQVEYIDLRTWGYINRGFQGHAVISAYFWEHEVFAESDGGVVRNTLGLAATIVERSGVLGNGAAVDAIRHGAPLDVASQPELLPLALRDFAGLCVRGPGFFGPRPTRTRHPNPPSPTPTLTPWPTPAHIAPVARAPAMRFPAAGGIMDPSGAPVAPCTAEVVVYNSGERPARALLVAQPPSAAASDGALGDDDDLAACGRGFEVLCSGLLAPQSVWRWTLPEHMASGAALTLLSLDQRAVRAWGIDAPGSFAGTLCATLERQLDEGCLRWPQFLDAWRHGEPFAPLLDDPQGPPRIPIPPGAPLVAEIHRDCGGGAISYAPVLGLDLGWAEETTDAGEGAGGQGGGLREDAYQGWVYSAPLPTALGLGLGKGDDAAVGPLVVHVQATTGLTTALEVDWRRASDGVAIPCGRWDLPGGSYVALDLRACVAHKDRVADPETGQPGENDPGALHFVADAPLAIVVDGPGNAVSAGDVRPGGQAPAPAIGFNLKAQPLRRQDPRSRPPLGATDEVTFAPLLYNERDGWRSRLRVHNPDPQHPTRIRVTIFHRDGGPLAVRDVPWVAAGGTYTLDLGDMLELTRREEDTVLHARIERVPGTPMTPTPVMETATPMAERATPTVTVAAPPTIGPAPATATRTSPRLATPTVTGSMRPIRMLFLPITLDAR